MVVIINYGAGNIYSVFMAIKKIGMDVIITSDLKDLEKSDFIILPGVGAFGDGMKNLRERGLDKAIKKEIEKNKPFLGICLGLQLLFSESEEGDCEGLGLIDGKVKRFKFENLVVPHMGWNRVKFENPSFPLFEGIPDKTFFYFAHSYYAQPEEKILIEGTTEYGVKFPSIVRLKNVIGVQFHPEKSGDYGVLFLKNFLQCEWLQRE